MFEDPSFKPTIKDFVARERGRDVWQRTYSRLSPLSKWAVRACVHDVGRVETRPFHTHAMKTCMVDEGRVPYHASYPSKQEVLEECRFKLLTKKLVGDIRRTTREQRI